MYYYHFDGLGSVAALSDANSVIVERYSYDVFGEPNRVSGVHNTYMFTGRRYDIETGLYYYRTRYYKPEIGRFLQTDPIGYVAGLNMYAYVGNNPVRFTDPFGLVNPGMGDWYWGDGGFPGTPGPPSLPPPPGFSDDPYPRDPSYFGPPGLMPGPSMPQPGDRCCKLWGGRFYKTRYKGNLLKCIHEESVIYNTPMVVVGIGEYCRWGTPWTLVGGASEVGMAAAYCLSRVCVDFGRLGPCGVCE